MRFSFIDQINYVIILFSSIAEMDSRYEKGDQESAFGAVISSFRCNWRTTSYTNKCAVLIELFDEDGCEICLLRTSWRNAFVEALEGTRESDPVVLEALGDMRCARTSDRFKHSTQEVYRLYTYVTIPVATIPTLAAESKWCSCASERILTAMRRIMSDSRFHFPGLSFGKRRQQDSVDPLLPIGMPSFSPSAGIQVGREQQMVLRASHYATVVIFDYFRRHPCSGEKFTLTGARPAYSDKENAHLSGSRATDAIPAYKRDR